MLPGFLSAPRREKPAWLRGYVLGFTGMCLLFVPVIFHFGMMIVIVPAGWGVWRTWRSVSHHDLPLALAAMIHLVVYLAVFLGMALLTDALLRKVRWRALRLLLRAAILCGLFSCSFLHVLTYGSLAGRGGTYTFWTAVPRFVETRGGR